MEQKCYHVTEAMVEDFLNDLTMNERSRATIEKYNRDIRKFRLFLAGEGELTKATVRSWKESLLRDGYAVCSINSMLAALNSFFTFLEWGELRVRQLKYQRQPFREKERDLSKAEYYHLLKAAKQQKKQRLLLLLETICSTGIRVSEVSYLTLKAVEKGTMTVSLKGKCRTVFLPHALCAQLRQYARAQRIREGKLFLTRHGKPLSRNQIWAEMKGLCKLAGVERSKVFPHNLRHLFARCYYALSKDLPKLADLLGHSSIETTRLYIATSGKEHEEQINLLRLIPWHQKKKIST